MCYYQKEFKIKLSSNSSACDFHFHVIFMSGHKNYQTLSPSRLIPLLTSGLQVSVHGVQVLPLVKTSQKDGLGLEWVGQSPSSLSLSQPGTPMGHQEVSVFRVLISNNETLSSRPLRRGTLFIWPSVKINAASSAGCWAEIHLLSQALS